MKLHMPYLVMFRLISGPENLECKPQPKTKNIAMQHSKSQMISRYVWNYMIIMGMEALVKIANCTFNNNAPT